MGGCEGIFCLNVGISKHVERNRCNKKEITLVMKQCSRECEKWCSETVHLWQQVWQRFFRNQIIFFVMCSFLNVCKFFLGFSYWFSASFIFSKTSRTAISLASFFLFLSSYSILGPDDKRLHFKQKWRNLLDTILWTSISVVKVFPLSTWKTSIGHSLWTDCPITGHFQDWSKKVETLQYYSICVIDVFDV